VVICLERGADLHMAQLMPLPLTVSCSSKIQIGFIFLVPAHLGSLGKGPLNGYISQILLGQSLCATSLHTWGLASFGKCGCGMVRIVSHIVNE